MDYAAIPAELQKRNQWCLAREDKAPCRLGSTGAVILAKVNQPSTWMSFKSAVMHGERLGLHIGYVLTEKDPYTVVDLDVKDAETPNCAPEKYTSQEQLDVYDRIIQDFNTYTEFSTSGKGLHMWVKGSIPRGIHTGEGVELYSNLRFIICTGAVVIAAPIEERQELLNRLFKELTSRGASYNNDKGVILDEIEPESADEDIYDQAVSAANSDKFCALWDGDWESLEYPSQSEADFALLAMLAFYTKSNDQVRRLFRTSVLGQREKAMKNDSYLNRSLIRIRKRQQYEDSVVMSHERACKQELPLEQLEPLTESVLPPIKYPPGILGDLAKFIFNNSHRPVMEIAIATAIGFASGVCGKAYNVSGSGLNHYVVVVAQSGVGKETLHSGLSTLVAQLKELTPLATECVDFSVYASAQGLSKALQKNTCFVNVFGEIGQKLKEMTARGANNQMVALMTLLTHLFQKSGPDTTVGGLRYSDSAKDIASVSGVALSIIGESTPGAFYDALTEQMMESGFMSRLLVIEYVGDRPAANYDRELALPLDLLSRLSELIVHSRKLMNDHAVVDVCMSLAAEARLREFDRMCDIEVNKSQDEGWRQMWSRAHLKTWKLAGLLAAMNNPLYPVIDEETLFWAMGMVNRDIHILGRRLSEGSIGVGDDQRIKQVLASIKKYMQGNTQDASYSPALARQGIIPRRFIQANVGRKPMFTKHNNGATFALDSTLQAMISCGYIVELSRNSERLPPNSSGKYYLSQVLDHAVLSNMLL